MIHPRGIDKGRFRKFGKLYSDGLHAGHDFDCPIKTEVKAISKGIILLSIDINGFGSLNPSTKGGAIFIQHDKIIALYGHLSRLVNEDEKVEEGQVIGTIINFSNHGESLPHLHFGIYNDIMMPDSPFGYVKQLGLWIDPIKYLAENGVKI